MVSVMQAGIRMVYVYGDATSTTRCMYEMPLCTTNHLTRSKKRRWAQTTFCRWLCSSGKFMLIHRAGCPRMPGLQEGTKVKTAIHTFPSHEGGGKACTRIMTESATQSTKQKSPPAVTMPTATTLVKVVGVDSKLLCIYL